MHTIGFATQFYTLWDVQTEPVYFTDARGNHHLVRHKQINNYIKNISKDLDKAQAAYPSAPVDENLRGKTRSFTFERDEDLCPELLKFGKYRGKTIQEVAETDLPYILWLIENARNETRIACMALPKVIELFAQQQKEREEKIASFVELKSGKQEVTFMENPNKQVFGNIYAGEELQPFEDYFYARVDVAEEQLLYVLFKQVSPVSGIYPYNMAVISGKAKRIKNKTVNLDLNIIRTIKSEFGVVTHFEF